jgi:hypothetical protein
VRKRPKAIQRKTRARRSKSQSTGFQTSKKPGKLLATRKEGPDYVTTIGETRKKPKGNLTQITWRRRLTAASSRQADHFTALLNIIGHNETCSSKRAND